MATEKRLIDANALMEEARRCSPFVACLGDIVDIELLVNDQPTVEAVEVVHGRWEDRENPQWKAYDIRHCSVCGWSIPKTKLRQKDSHWNYCPNCGAKMDGDGNG